MLMKMRGQMQKGRNQKGFTLVELMVVVVIIGILVAIAVPVYKSTQDKAEKSACQANQRIIDSAVMQYQLDNSGEYPANLEALKDYFQDEPKCPVAGNTYEIPSATNPKTTCSNESHNR